MSRPAVLVTGDCQALDIAAAAIRIPALNERFEFVHLNCSGYGERIERPSEDQARRAVMHWRQSTASSPPAVDDLVAPMGRLTFPTTALGVYLPFQAFDALRPANTWLGDRVLVTLEEQGAPVDEIPEAYYALSKVLVPNLRRLSDAQVSLLQQAEQSCDVKPSVFMAAHMHRRRLFWDFDHAAPPMIAGLLSELVRLSWPRDPALQSAVEDALSDMALSLFAPHPWQAPIARIVRERLDLDWVQADARYAWHGRTLTEDDYLKLYVSDRRRLRAGQVRP